MALRDPHERGGDGERRGNLPGSTAASPAPTAPPTETNQPSTDSDDSDERVTPDLERVNGDRQETGAPFTQFDGPLPAAEDADEAATDTCPDCGGATRAVENSGVTETVCVACGLVLDADDLDTGPEWNPSDHDADKGHRVERATGGPSTVEMHDKGLGSNIGRRFENPAGDSGRRRQQRSRMRRMNRQSRSGQRKDRTRREGLSEIARVCAALGFQRTIRQRAAYLYRQAVEEDLLAGRGIQQFVAASVYAAAREKQIACIPDDVAEPLRLTSDDTNGGVDAAHRVKNAYGVMCRELGLEIRTLRPRDHIPSMAQKAGVSNEVCHRALTLVEQAHGDAAFSGYPPTSVAAGAIYLANQQVGTERVTQRGVAEAVGKSEVTVRNLYQTLAEYVQSAASDEADDGEGEENPEADDESDEADPEADDESDEADPEADDESDTDDNPDEADGADEVDDAGDSPDRNPSQEPTDPPCPAPPDGPGGREPPLPAPGPNRPAGPPTARATAHTFPTGLGPLQRENPPGGPDNHVQVQGTPGRYRVLDGASTGLLPLRHSRSTRQPCRLATWLRASLSPPTAPRVMRGWRTGPRQSSSAPGAAA
jgi:transcription initiation factor TFIIB